MCLVSTALVLLLYSLLSLVWKNSHHFCFTNRVCPSVRPASAFLIFCCALPLKICTMTVRLHAGYVKTASQPGILLCVIVEVSKELYFTTQQQIKSPTFRRPIIFSHFSASHRYRYNINVLHHSTFMALEHSFSLWIACMIWIYWYGFSIANTPPCFLDLLLPLNFKVFSDSWRI